MQQHQSLQVDTSLVAQLYQRHASTIFLQVRRQVFSLEDAEDITLEIFLAAVEQKEMLRGLNDEARLAWLRRVAHNKVVDHYRRSARRPLAPLEEADGLLDEDENRAPEPVALRSEEYALLRSRLATLPPQQQEILHLRFAGGLRSREIASLLNKPEGSIRSTLTRALNFLRSVYEH
ncbi:MAG TPA: RNA polymerase sigma factor [Ktedonobacteraceae bacterium]